MSYSGGVFKWNISSVLSPVNDSSTIADFEDGFHIHFIFEGIIVPIIACFGLVGNTLTMCVLFRREMRSSTVLYLRALVITDTIILLLALAGLTPFSIARISDNMTYYKYVLFPLTITYLYYALLAVMTCNVWITVCVSVERYIAICHPFEAARITTLRNTRIIIISVTVFSIVFSLPRIFITTSRPCLSDEAHCYELYFTDFGQQNIAHMYMTWMLAIAIFIIPLTVLFVLNIRIVVELKRMTTRRMCTLTSPQRRHDKTNVSVVLVLVVAVFMICHTPRLIGYLGTGALPSQVSTKFAAVSDTMFVLNSSVNFLFYVFVGRHFREVFVNGVCYRCVDSGRKHMRAYELQRVYNTPNV